MLPEINMFVPVAFETSEPCKMLRVQNFSRSWDLALHLVLKINAKLISCSNVFPSMFIITKPLYSEARLRVICESCDEAGFF